MQLVWSYPLPAAPVGLSLAREPGTFLIWDVEHHVARYDPLGQVIVRQLLSSSLLAAVCSDDGQSVAMISSRGKVRLLTAEFALVFERAIEHRPTAVAVDALGRRVAVAEEKGGVHVFDRTGKSLWRATTARPLVHLAFLAESPALVGCAEFGLVTAFDREGKELWRDGLVAHVGGMAVTGNGSRIVLACFTEGLNCYGLTESKRNPLTRAAPSRLVALDYRGEVLVTTGLANELASRGREGDIRRVLLLPANPVAIALEALGDAVVVALASGGIARVEMTEA